MNPIYKFMLSVNGGTSQQVHPVWTSLEKEWQKESGNAFFRASLSGRLTFQGSDYLLIKNGYLEDKFDLEILISYDSSTWNNYWNGYFYKTDCEIDENDNTVIVQPKASDEYDAIINALDKEIDLIPAAPRITPVMYHKRPVVQFYIAGQAVVGCYLDGMYWEQSSLVENDVTVLNNTYKFGLLNSRIQVIATGSVTDFFWGNVSNDFAFDDDSGTYTFHRERAGTLWNFYITYVGQSQKLYGATSSQNFGSFTLQAISGSGMTGTVDVLVSPINVCARLICDVDTYAGVTTEVLPDDDLTETTYHRSVALNQADFSDIVRFSHILTSTPTQWGIYQPNQYYDRLGDNDIPMARNSWTELSIWLRPDKLTYYAPHMFEEGAKEIVNKDCYPIESVLTTMLNKLGVPLTFAPTAAYSEFFYGDTTTAQGAKIKNVDYSLFITPKSNILKGEYDQPAQKAIVTLREILEMFKKCFKCYWFIESGKLRLEHIYWFKNGGSYGTAPVVGRDLTTEYLVRNGKKLGYAQSSYTYDKPETVGQIQFAWMDDVTKPFKGDPMTIISPYVQQDSVEDVDVSKFTTDVDYMQVAPNECSQDGFAMFACVIETESIEVNTLLPMLLTEPLKAGDIITSLGSGSSIILYPTQNTGFYYSVSSSMLPYVVPEDIVMCIGSHVTMSVRRAGEPEVPYVQLNYDNKLQNGYLSFWYLQRYYEWDMPAYQYRIGDGSTQMAFGVQRIKTQNVSFPALNDIDIMKLIKTNIGNGQIEKISINLSDRNARVTLKFDETTN